jgi:Zn-dependent peptidase ImmA (M78 family)
VNSFRVNRDARRALHPARDIVEGLEDSRVLRDLFPDRRARLRFVRETQVRVSKDDIYCFIDADKGVVVLGESHLRTSPEREVYLDMLHELVHIQQLRDGRELFDRRYPYVDRPTEVEAYEYGVAEARRLGMTDEEILDYLQVPWITEHETQRLAARLGLRLPKRRARTPR